MTAMTHAIPVLFGEPLTAREIEVLWRVAKGQRNQEIATELGWSCSTIRDDVRDALTKLGARNRAAAVYAACRRRLLPMGEPND